MHYKCYANAKFMKLYIHGNFSKFWSILKMNATEPYIRNSNYAHLHTGSGQVNFIRYLVSLKTAKTIQGL